MPELIVLSCGGGRNTDKRQAKWERFFRVPDIQRSSTAAEEMDEWVINQIQVPNVPIPAGTSADRVGQI